MNARATGVIDVDWAAFDPSRIRAVRQRLTEHPLLQPAQRVEFHRRLGQSARRYSFGNNAVAATDFNEAGEHASEPQIRGGNLRDNSRAWAWMLLPSAQGDPEGRQL